MRAGHDDADTGQIMLLVLGFVVLVLALIVVVSAISALHLQRKRVVETASAAAADAADNLDLRAYYEASGPLRSIPLTDDSVRDSVQDYLAATGGVPGCTEVRVTAQTGTPDGSTAQVGLACAWRTPIVSDLLPQLGTEVVIPATARARATVMPLQPSGFQPTPPG
ncbi:MAG: hypothetical protein CSB46_10975 [Micrococcales bacterium]|nr:MAG: hypothetical protein CSB46_10975 [Micrococcales bacterium]